MESNLLKFNEAFVSVTRDIPPLSPIPFPDTQLQSDYTTIPTEYIIREEDIYYKLSSISSSKSAGPDEIPNWVLKDYAPLLAPPVTSIFNTSLQQASVPAVWKKPTSSLSLKIRCRVTLLKACVPSRLLPLCQKRVNVLSQTG